MSLDDPDNCHLAVLGLTTSGEKDTLERLLAGKRCSTSTDLQDENEWCEFQYGDDVNLEPTHETRTCPPREDKGRQNHLKKKKKTLMMNGDESKRISKESVKSQAPHARAASSLVSSSKQKDMPVYLPPSAAFQADKTCKDAELLPPLTDLLHGKLLRPLTESFHVSSLTRIQKLSWTPMVDRTRDVLIRSETGSGKTLAYALPLLHQLLGECDEHPIQRQIGTIIIVLCPTRELVVQVTDVLRVLTRCALFLTVGGIHGGENRHKEKARLRKGIPILIATPGRLLDHLKATASFRAEGTRTIVLDEADRLLDMGFESTIREIMELLLEKTERSTSLPSSTGSLSEKHSLKRVLVSATITAGVERLSHFALRSNVLRVGETEDTFSIPSSLRQHYVLVPTKHRLSTLVSFLRSQLDAGAQRIIVFVSTADSAEFHYCLLSRLRSPFNGKRKHPHSYGASEQRNHHYSLKRRIEEANKHIHDQSQDVVTFDDDSDSDDGEEQQTLLHRNALLDVNIFKLHGNMSQVDRASVFMAFKQVDGTTRCSQKGVLFCTDVAARGLDMPRVDWIVHYDPPTDPACYVHRIGRTARIGNVGDSLLFLMPHEAEYVPYLSNFIAKQGKISPAEGGKAPATLIEERKFESFLFYLTKLDPKANHMWLQSTATLERAISRLVMRRDGAMNESPAEKESRKDDLTRLALFAYQSYVRAYAGHSRELKARFFNSEILHLGHVAQSFGFDKKPSEVQAQLQSLIKEDRRIAREASSLYPREDEDEEGEDGERGRGEAPRNRRRLQVEVRHDGRYRSMIVQKQRKVTRDWFERKRNEEPTHKALHFTEFDA